MSEQPSDEYLADYLAGLEKEQIKIADECIKDIQEQMPERLALQRERARIEELQVVKNWLWKRFLEVEKELHYQENRIE